MYRVYIENEETEECNILDFATSEKEAYRIIREYTNFIDFTIHYIRRWQTEENETKYDFGSHTEFIIAEEADDADFLIEFKHRNKITEDFKVIGYLDIVNSTWEVPEVELSDFTKKCVKNILVHVGGDFNNAIEFSKTMHGNLGLGRIILKSKVK